MEKAICDICKEGYGDYGEHAWSSHYTHSATPGFHVMTCDRHSSHTKEEACSGGTATCTDAAICTSCEHSYGDALGHAFGNWQSNGDGTHTRTCQNGCGQVEEAACSGSEATCDAPGLCTVCNGEWGGKRIHWYGQWQYSDTKTAPHHRGSCKYADCTYIKTVPCQLITVEPEGGSPLHFCPVCGYSPDALFAPVSAGATGETGMDLMVYITEKPTKDALWGISIFWEQGGEPIPDTVNQRMASFPLPLEQVSLAAAGPVGGIASYTFENGILTVDVTGYGCAFILVKGSEAH